ncbi:SRPBCC family protein [Glycomyces tarimensis]
MESGPSVAATMSVPRERVFEVLSDGWNYAGWVVGASHIRNVDEHWPSVGATIHHSVGLWPLAIEDSTEAVACEPPRLLVLDARLWPMGQARIRLELFEEGPSETRVVMTELATGGPPMLLPVAFQARLLAPRNRESLRRLQRMAERS